MSLTVFRAGDLLDVWDGGRIVSVVVLGEEKGRYRVVTEAGEEIRIPASRVANLAGHGAPADPRRAAAAAAHHAAAAREMAGTIEVAPLWDLLVDEGGRHTLADLAGLALGRPAPEATSALIRRLTAERTYFERKGEHWEARSREAVEETRKRERAEAERDRRRREFVERSRERLRARGEERGGAAGPRGFTEEDTPMISMIVDLSVRGEEAPERKEAQALLEEIGASGPAPSAAAFEFLVRAGLFREDENLEIRRHALRTSFPPEVLLAAEEAAGRVPPADRADLRSLAAFSIDDETTVEIDDALSWEPEEDGGATLGVHIADPSTFVEAGGVVDAEALRRAATYYFPDTRLPMIPPALSERAASLVAGQDRPALSFLVRVEPDGRLGDPAIRASTIRSRRRLTYEEADAILSRASGAAPAAEEGQELPPAIGSALAALGAAARRLEEGRLRSGAILIRAPEIIVKVDSSGSVSLVRIDDRGPARRMVSEMMILANRIAAEFCSSRGIPAIYRRQPPPERRPDPIPDGPYDAVAVRALRRSLRRGEVCLSPDTHFALGLPAYLQITSPLRRYQDLAMQRQIEACLAGVPLPYDAEALARVAATTEEAERAARRAESGVEGYFILKYLNSKRGTAVEGVIVAAEPRRTEVEIAETLTSAVIAPRPDHVPGARLSLIIEEAKPREGILRLREIGRIA